MSNCSVCGKEARKKLLKGMLDLVVLRLIAEKPMHGYAMIQKIRRRHNIYFGPSTIYPLLNTLEAKGYIKSEWTYPPQTTFKQYQKKSALTKPRKIYTITQEGLALLEDTQTELKLIVKPLIEVQT